MKRHGGLSEILRTGQAPGAIVSGGYNTRRLKHMVIPGVPRPPKGWTSARQIDAACEAAGVPGGADHELARRVNESIRRGLVAADKRTDIDPGRRG